VVRRSKFVPGPAQLTTLVSGSPPSDDYKATEAGDGRATVLIVSVLSRQSSGPDAPRWSGTAPSRLPWPATASKRSSSADRCSEMRH
jgi:hypothetical protein